MRGKATDTALWSWRVTLDETGLVGHICQFVVPWPKHSCEPQNPQTDNVKCICLSECRVGGLHVHML